MLPGIILAVALTTDPVAASAWPISERDAELAATEAALRDRIDGCMTGIEHFWGERKRWEGYLSAIGGGAEDERKMIAKCQQKVDEFKDALNEARDQIKQVQNLRQHQRKLRGELQNKR